MMIIRVIVTVSGGNGSSGSSGSSGRRVMVSRYVATRLIDSTRGYREWEKKIQGIRG